MDGGEGRVERKDPFKRQAAVALADRGQREAAAQLRVTALAERRHSCEPVERAAEENDDQALLGGGSGEDGAGKTQRGERTGSAEKNGDAAARHPLSLRERVRVRVFAAAFWRRMRDTDAALTLPSPGGRGFRQRGWLI